MFCLGTIPAYFLSLGIDIQPSPRREDEQIQRDPHSSRHFERLCQRKGNQNHFGCV